MEDYKVLVVIPAYNEEKNIAMVVDRVREAYPTADIVVVNDGSADATVEAAEATGAGVISLPFNLGIGGAVQTGYKYAKDHNYDLAVQVDGDGQHNPQSISDLLEPLIRDEADLAVGSRYIKDLGYKTPFSRRMGMLLFSWVISVILRQRITDTTSGFRAVNKEAIRFLADYYPTDYPEVEALVIMHYAKFRIKEVPVLMQQRQSGSSSITIFRSVYYMVKVFLAIFIWLLREKPTQKERAVS